SASTAYLQI
nr:immunoglobulin heavy chain junction region [Mus musculus]